MRIHNVEQGTPEWLMLRAGIPTASQFEKIVTPTGKLSKSSRDYKAWLLAERILRAPLTTKQSASMIRGTEFEASAVEFYEGVREVSTRRVGFITNDAGTIGASPDRLVGADRGWEIKVPECHTHMGYFLAQQEVEACQREISRLIDATNKQDSEYLKDLQKRYDDALKQTLEQEYRVQTQGQIWVAEFVSSDVLSYSPEGLPAVFALVPRDKPFIEILAASITEFSRELEAESARLVASGVIQQE